MLIYIKELLRRTTDRSNKISKQEILMRQISDELKDNIQDIIKAETHVLKQQLCLVIDKHFFYLKDELDRLKHDNLKLTKSFISLEQEVFELRKQLECHNATLPSGNSYVVNDEIKELYPICCFSEMIDCYSPLGFKAENIRRKELNCVFKIEIQSASKGTYQFVEDTAIQDEILSAFNPIITESAEYDSLPTTPSKIIIVSPGEICLKDGVWQITKKQKIAFD